MRKCPRKGPPSATPIPKAPALRGAVSSGGLLQAFLPSTPLTHPPASPYLPCTPLPDCFHQVVSMSWMSQWFLVLKPSPHAAPGGLYLLSFPGSETLQGCGAHCPSLPGGHQPRRGLACGGPSLVSFSPSLPVPLWGELPH